MYSSVDTIWVLLGAALVFFMQAGFAMVETGFTRAKNAGNIIMKNTLDFTIGSIAFWILGFGLMFGATNFGLVGTPDFFVRGDYSSTVPTMAFFIFQTVFSATAATIVSGAMAERTKFVSYCIYSLMISALVYPVSGHWIWGGGWLSNLGFHDFAGSTAVHMVGGIAAFLGAKALGPRIGKYEKDGKPNAILGHNLTIGALGVFILWFCWFGFNGTSTVSMTGDEAIVSASTIFVTTNMAAAVATTSAMIITWIRYKKPDVSMTLNASLGGLVAITAGCDVVSVAGAAAIGLISSLIIIFGIEFLDKKLKIDDPVGAVAVHGMCGAAGTVMVGIFALDGGLLYGGGTGMLLVQTAGVLAVGLWVLATMTTVFKAIDVTVGLRVSEEEEITGLDIMEHGLISAYADFMPALSAVSSYTGYAQTPIHIVRNEEPVLFEEPTKSKASKSAKLTKIVIIINQNKFQALKEAMNKIEITGMTVTNVLGCGVQKGYHEYYRGVRVDMNLLPKIQVEIVVSKVPARLVIEKAKEVLHTGGIGDGKIFVYDVENAVKIRTGEEGYDALQDEDINPEENKINFEEKVLTDVV
ncbi:ammonium transporter [Sedimentibacter saalensis]|uniref:Ammonium transporter (TC 1.A.11) n=1 Tax=Sedimentibacter saalensis TaxID=130788 RepID=A0A562IZR5_9FIRM|nr:ammonium transporter [Sedimentibacter saalensis]TWH76416.1 ammonium transporter (TC 1.A.11) [Sedimentibacter saalensis]